MDFVAVIYIKFDAERQAFPMCAKQVQTVFFPNYIYLVWPESPSELCLECWLCEKLL